MNNVVPNRGMITVSIMLSTIMQALDTTIANVALPPMQGALSATMDEITWVLTSYIVASAIATPVTGYFEARFGRKPYFAFTVTGFVITSMLCGAATSLDEMVFFRIMQGIFGAALIPLSQAVLLDSYPKEEHGKAMAIWGMGIMVGPILGPTLGGYLTEYYNWRWVFYINLPVGILSLLGILAFVTENEQRRDRPFDMFGFVVLSIAIGSLQLMLDRGTSQDWFSSTEIITEATLFILCLYLFVVHMFTATHAYLEPELFKDRNFVVGLVFIFVVGIILLATMALLPPFLQNLMGFPVLDVGYVLAPRGIGTMFSMMFVGKVIGNVDPRRLIFAGLLCIVFSLWEMAQFNTDISMWAIIHTGILQGIGLGLIFVPLSTITFATLAPHLRTEAASLFSLLRNLGSSIGISVVVGLLGYYVQANHSALAEHITPFIGKFLPPIWSLDSTGGLMAINGEINRQAATISYLNDFRFMMYVTAAALPLLFMLQNPLRQKTH